MDSHQLFGIGSTTSSHPIVPSLPSKLLGTFKLELGNSPNSPYSSNFDSDTVSAASLSDYSSSAAENNPSSSAANSPLETESFFPQFSPIAGGNPPLPLPPQNYANTSNRVFRHALLELESALMGPDEDQDASPAPIRRQSSLVGWPRQATHEVLRKEKRQKAADEEPGSGAGVSSSSSSPPSQDLKQLLIACAAALSENNGELFEMLVEKARAAVSITGDPMQRLGAYMLEGMVARTEASGAQIYRALRCHEPEGKDLLSYMQILYEICPYLKFGYMAANGAIAEACRTEDQIHIIDFQIAQGTQWLTLLQALAARPNGPPRVRITGIDDPLNRHARGEGLAAVGRRLDAVSQAFNIPVEFNPISVFAPDVKAEMLGVRQSEALVVNFPLQLHHTPDESVDVMNPRDGLLRMVKSLAPRVVTLVEQESNTNTTPFFHRFVETLDYYLAMFESIDVALPRDSKHRISVEQHCLARDIVNVVASEGRERVERHELFGKWKSRFTMAGFRQYPLSSYVNSVIRSLLRCYSEHYTLAERDGAMLLGWKERNLISASAWY